MGFRSIGKIAAGMVAKALENRSFPLKQNESTDTVMSEPDRCWKHRPGSDQTRLGTGGENG